MINFQLKRKTKNLPKEDQKKDEKSEVLPFVPKRRWVPIIFAREVGGVFKVTVSLFLLVSLLATLKLASESADLRSRAAKGPLAPVFCIGRAMCSDGHCEGDSWADCDECPKGRAKIITEVRCGIYKETECIHETETCGVGESDVKAVSATGDGKKISVDFQEESSKEVAPLDKSPVYSFLIRGDVSLGKNNSYIRVILVDDKKNEYLVYEAYPLIVDSQSFSIKDSCDETCVLDAVKPAFLRIEGFSSSIRISKTSSSSAPPKSKLSSDREKFRKEKDRLKIGKINEQVVKKGIGWDAGETSISKMSYAQKKRLFTKSDGTPVDRLPNLQGFEYYKGGVFEIPSEIEQQIAPESFEESLSSLPSKWDWRNVHGENWNTPVRNQGQSGTCWAHAAVGAMESQINVYYNQHLDVDLSEQMFVDCINGRTLPIGMNPSLFPDCRCPNCCYPGDAYCVIHSHGLADESCDPYDDSKDIIPPHCDLDNICSDWQSRVWKLESFHDYKFLNDFGTPACPLQTMNLSEDDFKRVLIEKGPLRSSRRVSPTSMSHAMVLVGYEVDPPDNKTIWIYKNSWGPDWGESGYMRYKADSTENIGFGSLPINPTPPVNEPHQISCVDKDGDTYCNWGISEVKPSTCPASCKPQKDCNDANPLLGPFDGNLNCVSTCQVPAKAVRIAGPGANATIKIGNPRLGIKDVSGENSCFLHDVRFTVWQGSRRVRNSGWAKGVIQSPQGTYYWRMSVPLPPGSYKWMAEIRNSVGGMRQYPLVVPFTVIASS